MANSKLEEAQIPLLKYNKYYVQGHRTKQPQILFMKNAFLFFLENFTRKEVNKTCMSISTCWPPILTIPPGALQILEVCNIFWLPLWDSSLPLADLGP